MISCLSIIEHDSTIVLYRGRLPTMPCIQTPSSVLTSVIVYDYVYVVLGNLKWSNNSCIRVRITITCIRRRIAKDVCIQVRIIGIRVRITSRGRIAEVVLGCSGHYIDPKSLILREMLPLEGGNCAKCGPPPRVRLIFLSRASCMLGYHPPSVV